MKNKKNMNKHIQCVVNAIQHISVRNIACMLLFLVRKSYDYIFWSIFFSSDNCKIT